jgi:hypothetical protein
LSVGYRRFSVTQPLQLGRLFLPLKRPCGCDPQTVQSGGEPTFVEPVINSGGFAIPSTIHTARPEVACVLHTHSIAGCAVSMQRDGLLPLNPHALQIIGDITYHDYEGAGRSAEERARLLADRDDRHILVLRNHGLLIVGKEHRRGLYRHLSHGTGLCFRHMLHPNGSRGVKGATSSSQPGTPNSPWITSGGAPLPPRRSSTATRGMGRREERCMRSWRLHPRVRSRR